MKCTAFATICLLLMTGISSQLPATVVDIATSNADFSTLVAAVAKADLVGALSEEGPFTVFAPTNAAFEALLAKMGATPEELLANPFLAAILKYHVVPGKALSTNLSNGQEVNTLLGRSLVVTLSDGKVMINNATVTTPDLEAGNGVVHVIDTVLIPPTVVDLGEADPDFEILMDAIQTAGLRDTINDNGPFTVFAPINNAFQSLLAELSLTKEELLASPDLPDILKYHVVEGLVSSSDLSDGQIIPTLAGGNLTVSVKAGSVMINDATVLTPDIYGLNGVVHVIDTVLLQPCTLPASVVEIATTNEGFSTLVAAVTAANLVETLQGEGPFTVFAPTDAAFLAAIQALNTTAADLLASPDLGSILTYHVAAGKVTSGSLTDGMQIKTVQGCNLAVSIASNGTVTVNGATVVMADLEACNGVVHVIDMVLLPEECGAEPSDDSEVSEVSGSKSIALLSSVVAVASVFVSLVI